MQRTHFITFIFVVFMFFGVVQLMRQDLRAYYGIFAQRKNSGVTTAGRYWVAVRKQQRNDDFCAVHADVGARNNGMRHAIAKQQLNFKRGTMLSVPFVQ
jgi:hypothetical protein